MKIAVKRCGVRGCPQKHYGKGFCKKHYTQITRHGGLTLERERGAERRCTATDCKRTDAHRCRGGEYLCKKHAKQVRTHGELTPGAERSYRKYAECSVQGCDMPHRAKGFCTKHYNAARWKRIKVAMDASLAPAPVNLVAENPVDIAPAPVAQEVTQ